LIFDPKTYSDLHLSLTTNVPYHTYDKTKREDVSSLLSFLSWLTGESIMYHLHKLRNHSLELACRAVDELLSLRLFAEENEEWVERASMMRIWITTSTAETKDSIHSLKLVLDNISSNTKKPFSSAATHAVQMVPSLDNHCRQIPNMLKLIDNSYFGSKLSQHILRRFTTLQNLGANLRTTLYS
jgi:hypothetical protein